jgi:serine/threonine protein kinase
MWNTCRSVHFEPFAYAENIGRYIVVDLMNGGDLRFHISRKTFTEDALRFWMAELGCALRYIHSQGIVHRDVKPDNILLDSQGHVHLADFVSLPNHPNTLI